MYANARRRVAQPERVRTPSTCGYRAFGDSEKQVRWWQHARAGESVDLLGLHPIRGEGRAGLADYSNRIAVRSRPAKGVSLRC